MLSISRCFHDGMRARVHTDDGIGIEIVGCHAGAASRLYAVMVTVQRFLRCCVSRRPSTLQPGRSHRDTFSPAQ